MQNKLLFNLVLVKFFSCAFAYFVFSRFVQLGDSEQYINASLDLSFNRLIDRTYLTENFFAFLAIFTGRGFGIHLTTSAIVALTIWYVFKPYKRVLPRIFWVVLLMPLFAVWTSVVGKESLAFCAFIVIVKWVSDVILYNKGDHFYMLCAVAVGAVLRPHYLLAYLILITIVYLFLYKKEVKLIAGKKLSEGIYIVFIFIFAFFFMVIALQLQEYWQPSLDYVMSTSQSYFLSYDGNTNRADISWTSSSDFIDNIYWGVPVSIIGPTFWESLQKPIMIPFFIEGVFSWLLIFYLFAKLVAIAKEDRKIRFFLYVAFFPAICVALLAHYPFGIFNSGTATRYKQSLTPLFYFLPILLVCGYNIKKRQVHPL